METRNLLYSLFLTLTILTLNTTNGWAKTWTKGNVTITSSGSTLIVSPVAETDGIMGDFDNFDGSGYKVFPHSMQRK